MDVVLGGVATLLCSGFQSKGGATDGAIVPAGFVGTPVSTWDILCWSCTGTIRLQRIDRVPDLPRKIPNSLSLCLRLL